MKKLVIKIGESIFKDKKGFIIGQTDPRFKETHEKYVYAYEDWKKYDAEWEPWIKAYANIHTCTVRDFGMFWDKVCVGVSTNEVDEGLHWFPLDQF